MNNFQMTCIKHCEKLFDEIPDLAFSGFREVVGKTQTYCVAELYKFNSKFEVYIYTDEAGFLSKNNEWIICEKPDFDSENELLTEFVSKLQAELSKP